MKNMIITQCVLAMSLFLLAACGKKAEHSEGPMESAGEEVDQAADETAEGAEEATENAGEAIEEAGDKAEDKTD